MNDTIWIVVNAGGDKPENRKTTKSNAEACLQLTNQRIKDGVDILSTKLLEKSRELKIGDRIAMHQGGGANFRKLGAGQLVACGRISFQSRPLENDDEVKYAELYTITRNLFPQTELAGIIGYELHKSTDTLQTYKELGIRINLRMKFYKVDPGHKSYNKLNEWWRRNYPES